MNIPVYLVDAFSNKPFSGNPAAVCYLEKDWPDDKTLQNIAAEHNQAETAFLKRSEDGSSFDLRWFTPMIEVDLCGHATLAAAFVIAQELEHNVFPIRFNTLSGLLEVTFEDDYFYLNFPTRALAKSDLASKVREITGIQALSCTQASKTLIAEYKDEQQILEIKPNFSRLMDLDVQGLIITAPGKEVDFVSRFFAPKVGVNEDAVTGSAHCGLIPFWYQKTKKTQLSAKQVSTRGGFLKCEFKGDRVLIGGQARLFSKGKIIL